MPVGTFGTRYASIINHHHQKIMSMASSSFAFHSSEVRQALAQIISNHKERDNAIDDPRR